MKISRWGVLLVAVVACSGVLEASPVDIQEVIRGEQVTFFLNGGVLADQSVEDPQVALRRLKRGSIPFSGLTFSFAALAGSGFFDYYNSNAFDLFTLTLTITPGGPPASTASSFGCGIETDVTGVFPFSSCEFQQTGSDVTSTIATFTGPPGLPPHSHFAVELDGFPANAQVSAAATPDPVPEPGVGLLFLSGLALVCGPGLVEKALARRTLG